MKNLYKRKCFWVSTNVILFIVLIILVISNFAIMDKAYSKNRLGNLSFTFIRNYYSNEILSSIMSKDKQNTINYDEREKYFSNYIIKLVIDDINKHE